MKIQAELRLSDLKFAGKDEGTSVVGFAEGMKQIVNSLWNLMYMYQGKRPEIRVTEHFGNPIFTTNSLLAEASCFVSAYHIVRIFSQDGSNLEIEFFNYGKPYVYNDAKGNPIYDQSNIIQTENAKDLDSIIDRWTNVFIMQYNEYLGAIEKMKSIVKDDLKDLNFKIQVLK